MHGVLIVKSSNGDDRLEWDTADPKLVLAAQAEFDRLFTKGYLGSKMTTPTEGEKINKFDPTAQEIIMSPAIVAG